MKKQYKLCAACLTALVIWILIASTIAATAYSDATTGISFSVPEGWIEKAVDEEPIIDGASIIQKNYVRQEDTGESIYFQCDDIWANMSESERRGKSRDQFVTGLLSQSMIEKILGNKDPVLRVQINGTEYFKVIHDVKVSANGQPAQYKAIEMIGVQNAFLCVFLYKEGNTGINHLNDFDSFVYSVRFPVGATNGEVANGPSSAPGARSINDTVANVDAVIMRVVWFMLAAVLFIYCLPSLVTRMKAHHSFDFSESIRIAGKRVSFVLVTLSCLLWFSGNSSVIPANIVLGIIGFIISILILKFGKKRQGANSITEAGLDS